MLYKKNYLQVGLASFLVNVFVLAGPLFIMNVYDRVVPNNAIETLWALAIGVVLIYCFDLFVKSLRNYLLDVSGKKNRHFIIQSPVGKSA